MTAAPTSEDVRVETSPDGAIRTITLARPEKRNALTLEMFETLVDAFEREPPSEERATVLRADGTVFCAGVDLGQRAQGPVAEGASPLEALCASIASYPLPVLAVVEGAAIGGGFMLLAHCDFVIATTGVKAGNAAVQMGIVPPWPLSRRVAAAAGLVRAREALLLGDLMRPSRLTQLIDAVVAPSDVAQATELLLQRLRHNAPLSLRAIKATINATAYLPAPHPEADELIRRAQTSADGKEGVLARRERREPRFRGA